MDSAPASAPPPPSLATKTFVLFRSAIPPTDDDVTLFRVTESFDPTVESEWKVWARFESAKPGFQQYMCAHFPYKWSHETRGRVAEYRVVGDIGRVMMSIVSARAHSVWKCYEAQDQAWRVEQESPRPPPGAMVAADSDDLELYRNIRRLEQRKRKIDNHLQYLMTRMKRRALDVKGFEIHDAHFGSRGRVEWVDSETTEFDEAKARQFLTASQAKECEIRRTAKTLRIE